MAFWKKYPSYLCCIASVTSLLSLSGCADGDSDSLRLSSGDSEVLDMLFDFDDGVNGFTLNVDAATYELDDAVNGKLIINFSDDGVRSSTLGLIPNTPLNWGALKDFNVAVDIENTGDSSVYMYMGFVDSSGSFQNKGLSVPAGSKGVYYVILDGPTRDIDSGMRESPAPWRDGETMMIHRWNSGNFNLASVSELRFFTRGNIADKTISIDNIRLRKNRPHRSDYMQGIVDKFGQNAQLDFPGKISTETELRQKAETELAELKEKPGFGDRSRFGGWKDGPKRKATGYFRVEKVDGKWWMIDPEGYLFFSHGPANVRMANLSTITGIDFRDESIRYVDPDELTPEDSIGVVNVSDKIRETKFITSPTRRNMFSWLPDYDDPLADHYSYRRSVHRGPVKSGETYSYYRANLERRYGELSPESYLRKWEEVTLDRMNSWGFTSFGNWVDPAFYPNQQVPYFANGWIIGDFQTLSTENDHWGAMPDFYDPAFKRRADATIAQIAKEVQGSPWCAGIFIDNEKSWGRPDEPAKKRYGLILVALSRNATNSYVKAAFSELLREQYDTIEKLNAAWGTDHVSWENFNAGVTLDVITPDAEADLSFLLEEFSLQYFKIVHDTLEKYLPNHLYMGARMASWGMPEETIKAALKYSDVMSFNIYDEGLREKRWSFFSEIDKPVVIGEFHIGAIDTGMHHPGLVMAADQADRARMYKAYMKTVTENPYLVGAHWFQYVDSPLTGRAFDGENYNVGFVSTTDIPYPEMIDAVREVMGDIYPRRYGNKGSLER